MQTIIIIGAGASGIMASASLLENAPHGQYHIHLFEKNKKIGKKVLISGGGRCNVTTSITDKKELSKNYVRGWNFIKKAIGQFGPKKTYEWFENHGVPLKIQEDKRIFPCSDNGNDIVGIFETIFAKYSNNITVHFGEPIESIEKKDHGYTVTSNLKTYHGDFLIVTTGGNAYSHTGSNGDGYTFARSCGHEVTALGPSLSSFLIHESWLTESSGTAFPKAMIRYEDKALVAPLLVTHFGISGPLAFQLSSHLAFQKITSASPYQIFLVPIAHMQQKEWDIFLTETFTLYPKKILINILSIHLPRKFAEILIEHIFQDIAATFVGSIRKKDREYISSILGNGIPIHLTERRPGDEFVTAGGVATHMVDPDTLESLISKNLFFAGEVLDVDGYTGGFSLQICWSSGYMAGKTIASRVSASD